MEANQVDGDSVRPARELFSVELTATKSPGNVKLEFNLRWKARCRVVTVKLLLL